MKIHHLQLGPLRSNCYIVETAPGRCVAIDIGGDSRLLLEFLKMKKLRLGKILLTHGHFDHIGGAEEVHQATGAEVYIHELDAHMLTSESASLASNMSFIDFVPLTDWTCIFGDCYINDGDCSFRVLHTPGHSRGSVCYICEDVIFSGDTLFCCSVGRTDFPDSSDAAMAYSLNTLYHLQGDYKVLPGHNESTTLGYEREANPYMKQFRGKNDD
ncbi:MAG: MBL fold metallo-hydrolase [Ruminococcus sp.]|uniref:MBL fold metallo-hydrolase n=1 Tax=Ruminococcus sp. TaxID=41978 RepID=UPI0025D0783B|nr:MBL fold metallo-hydrolase [Ruminococcus sp.]MBR5683379.1 MBL fold metallo-hydrolase [Ruminococcus sp.]